MKLTIKDIKGNDQGELETKFQLIENGKGTQAVHDTVVAYQAAQRMGTHLAAAHNATAGRMPGDERLANSAAFRHVRVPVPAEGPSRHARRHPSG